MGGKGGWGWRGERVSGSTAGSDLKDRAGRGPPPEQLTAVGTSPLRSNQCTTATLSLNGKIYGRKLLLTYHLPTIQLSSPSCSTRAIPCFEKSLTLSERLMFANFLDLEISLSLSLSHTHTHTHTLQIHALLEWWVGRIRRRKQQRLRWVFSFDLKEESEDK